VSLFHKHTFLSGVKDGYQFCKVCGKAVPVEPIGCEHIWEEFTRFDTKRTSNKAIIARTFIMKCSQCGEMKRHLFKVED